MRFGCEKCKVKLFAVVLLLTIQSCVLLYMRVRLSQSCSSSAVSPCCASLLPPITSSTSPQTHYNNHSRSPLTSLPPPNPLATKVSSPFFLHPSHLLLLSLPRADSSAPPPLVETQNNSGSPQFMSLRPNTTYNIPPSLFNPLFLPLVAINHHQRHLRFSCASSQLTSQFVLVSCKRAEELTGDWKRRNTSIQILLSTHHGAFVALRANTSEQAGGRGPSRPRVLGLCRTSATSKRDQRVSLAGAC